MRWAQTVRLNLSNDRQKVDSSDLNWGNSDRAKIVYTEKRTGKEEVVEINKINDSVKAAMSIIDYGGITDNRDDEYKVPNYVGSYLKYLLQAFYTNDDLTITTNSSYNTNDAAKTIAYTTLKNSAQSLEQIHFAKNKQFFFGKDNDDSTPAGIVIFNELNYQNPDFYPHTSLEYNKIKILNGGENIDQKLELSLDVYEENGLPVPTIELESKRQSCLIQPDEIKFDLQDISGNIIDDLCINNNSIIFTSFSETNEDSICELKSTSLFFKDFKYTNKVNYDDGEVDYDTPNNYEDWLRDEEGEINYNAKRNIGTSEFYGFSISNEGIHINQNPKIEHKQEGWSSNKPNNNTNDSVIYVPNNFRLYPVGWGNNHLSTGILPISSVVNPHENSDYPLTVGNSTPFVAEGNFNYYDFNLSKYCNEYFGHRNIYDTGPEYRMHVRIELSQQIKNEGSAARNKKYIAFCMNINLGRWYNYSLYNSIEDGSENLEVYDVDMGDDGSSQIGGIIGQLESNDTKFIPSSLLNYGWDSSGVDSSGENMAPIINFSKNKKGLLQIPGPHITPNKSNEQDGSYFSEEDGNVTTNLSTGPDHVVAHNLHGNYVYYQRWPCKVQTAQNLTLNRDGADPPLDGDSFKDGNGNKYECDYWIRIIWPDYEIVDPASRMTSAPTIDDISVEYPTGGAPGSDTKNIQIRLTQIA